MEVCIKKKTMKALISVISKVISFIFRNAVKFLTVQENVGVKLSKEVILKKMTVIKMSMKQMIQHY